MFLAKVVGKIVSTTKDEGLNGKKILIVAPIDMNGQISGKELVSIDSVGAGIGDQVYLCMLLEKIEKFQLILLLLQ